MAAILTDPSPGGPDRCGDCDAPFVCGLEAPSGCWCARLPALRAAPRAGAVCRCPTCMQRTIERERVHDAAGIGPIAPR
jgi:hypothetical protein